MATGVATVLAAACAPTPPAASPSQSSEQPNGDVRERVVAALQRPGALTRVQITTRYGGDTQGREQVETAWLDLPAQQARIDRTFGGALSSISILANGIQASYDRDSNSLSEYPPSLPTDGMKQKLPPSLQSPALVAAGPLTSALWLGQWKPLSQGEWQGKPAARWKTHFPGTYDSISAEVAIYLDPATWLPLGMESRPTQKEPDLPDVLSVVSYGITFIPLGSAPPGLFDVQALRDMKASYGGSLEKAKTVGFTVLWLGRDTHLGDGYPTVPLDNVGVTSLQEPNGPLVRFSYRGDYRTPEPPGQLHLVVWPRGRFEASAANLAGPSAWWRDSAVVRRPAVIDGLQAEYAIGQLTPFPAPFVAPLPAPDPPPVPAPVRAPVPPPVPTQGPTPGPTGLAVGISVSVYTELIIWLPDSVVRVSAPPMRGSPGTPPGAPPSAQSGAASPGSPPPAPSALPDFTDKNRFNNEEALRHLLGYLKVLR